MMTERPTRTYVIAFAACAAFLLLFCAPMTKAQRVAVISPEKNAESTAYADRISELLAKNYRTVERSAANAAFDSLAIATPFNQTNEETRSAGTVVGSDILVFVKAETQRRSSFERQTYFESSAALFITGSRSGELFHFELRKTEEDQPERSFLSLTADAESAAETITKMIPELYRKEMASSSGAKIEDHSRIVGEDKTTRPPMPYRQIKPVSTSEAFLFGVHATVDAEADITEDGSVANIRVIRWAGYGLEKAVTDAIRKMDWRPAERDGKNLPMRVMLRYNFTKLEKPDKN